MDNASLASVTDALKNVAGLLAERQRQVHPSHGGQPDSDFFDAGIRREAECLRRDGQSQLADGLLALRASIGAMDNE